MAIATYAGSAGKRILCRTPAETDTARFARGLPHGDWLAKQEQALLPVPYFHLVFTLPHVLNPLIQQNQRVLYLLLFQAASQTLLEFGQNRFGVQLGITAVLHTWSQTLLDHYHLHCIVTGGGISADGTKWVSSSDRVSICRACSLRGVSWEVLCWDWSGSIVMGSCSFTESLRPWPSPALTSGCCSRP